MPHEFVHSSSSDADACAVRNAWLEAAQASQTVLDRTTIQELLEQQQTIRARRKGMHATPPGVTQFKLRLEHT